METDGNAGAASPDMPVPFWRDTPPFGRGTPPLGRDTMAKYEMAKYDGRTPPK